MENTSALIDGEQFVEPCLGCEMVAGRISTPGGIIYEDGHWMLTHATSPRLPPLKGMLILQPKRHCTQLADLTLEEAGTLGLILRESSKAVEAVLHPAKIYAGSFGEGVRHVHFMIVPRLEGMPIGARLLKEALEDHLWICSIEEAADTATRVRDQLHLQGVQALHLPGLH